MLPIGIKLKSQYTPLATYGLIAANSAVFLWELSVNAQGTNALQATLANLALNVCSVGVEPLPNVVLDSFRSLFLHGSIGHLLGNMLFLYVFGRGVEEYFGARRFLLAYLLFGMLGNLAHIVFGGVVCAFPQQSSLVIGASGAIAGVMGAFLFLYPGACVDTIIGIFRPFFWRARVPAFFFLIYWFLMDFLMGIGWLFSAGVAHWAHIGGFLMGFLIAFGAGIFYKPAPHIDPFAHLDD